VDTDVFCPAQSNVARKTEALRILFVGRFHDQKNLPFLFKQAAQLPPNTFELHLVGDGPQRQHLKRLAAELGIAAAITWHGWIDRVSLPGIYQNADCLVNPSLYEGMPNVVLEAMACGLPIIASKVPGNEELVLDGETGFVFSLAEPDVLAKILERLTVDRALCLRLGSKARAHVTESFSWRSVAQAYVSLFSTAEGLASR
jgi:glycosyltransferase involved in cell wall biosynthesis